ncbi:hypothetical protein NBH00_21600 [Paraconexibacter antarcticus]|uniref:Uncharacterized protein n=1 Tax=Paraconexibacter antarcticus TaxID=2949664 RepID=A0ABY5DR47_9ACTN|nr:hypothetical protein [Paraconexibacter antarcticus]UTI63925.1 hypothetical protein NBH00_21600 [Paraconexibacter antarcticus]
MARAGGGVGGGVGPGVGGGVAARATFAVSATAGRRSGALRAARHLYVGSGLVRGTGPRDAAGLLAVVAAIAVFTIVRHAAGWLSQLHQQTDHLTQAVASPEVLGCAVLTGLLVGVVVVWRRRLVDGLLADRLQLLIVPTGDLDVSLEAVSRFASQLSRTRRRGRGWLERPAAGIRIRISSDEEGRLTYHVSAPGHARSILHAALGEYPDIELQETSPEVPDAEAAVTAKAGPGRRLPGRRGRAGVGVVRCELVLARAAHEPLGLLGLDPDPLQPLAAVVAGLQSGRGERAAVHVDVLAMTPGEARRWRTRTQRTVRRQQRRDEPTPSSPGRSGGSAGPLNLNDLFARPESASRNDVVHAARRQNVIEGLRAKAAGHGQLLAVQVLLEVRSPDRGTARSHLRALLACFDQFAAQNHWRAVGVDLPGLGFTGSDGPLRRRRFDARLATGRFSPPRRNVVGVGEIAGLLKPPTKHCHAPNVLRTAGTIAPPPAGLPTFNHEAELLPLGRVRDRHGERVVGVRLEDTFFSYMAGRSRYGKTELGLVQFIHLMRSGHGGLFLDPHADAITEIKHYLTDHGLRDRVVEINLSGPQARERQPGWNPLAMHGHPPEAAEAKVEALVDAFASALQWDERNTRALALTTQATQALIDLSIKLPAETAPTLFQIPTLLGNEDWRRAVLPHVSVPTRRFFQERFPRLPAEAITPVTNLIDRLRASTPVAGLLGSSVSTYDIRAAMDEGKIVLACPGSGGTRDRLLANFLVYDLLHAAKARADTPAQERRRFFVYLDEVQTYDGASSGNLAALLEQTAKYGVRAFLFNQNPERLTPATLNAVTTNRSHLLTTTVNAKAAALLVKEWGGTPTAQTVTQLARYTYLASVTLNHEPTTPFLVHGIPATTMHAAHRHPEQLPELEAAMDRTLQRRPVAGTIRALDTLDDRILGLLAKLPRTAGTGAPAVALSGRYKGEDRS